MPIDKTDITESDQSRKIRRVSQPDPMTFGGHPQPSLDVPYEVTINNKMCFYAITIMKAYQNYSFEELRFVSPTVKRSSESMLVRPNGDGSYSATWTPSSVGWYSLMITVDGYNMEDVCIDHLCGVFQSCFKFNKIHSFSFTVESILEVG